MMEGEAGPGKRDGHPFLNTEYVRMVEVTRTCGHTRTPALGLLLLMIATCFLSPDPTLAQRAGAPGLGVDGLVVSREAGTAAVLARATDQWRGVSSRSEELLGEFRFLPEYASSRAKGQVFEVIQADGRGLLPGSGGSFVVVPWSFGPGCAEEGWQATEWVNPGDTVTFLLTATRIATETGGGYVFDVLGWHQPYPVGELIPFWRRTPGITPHWLGAEDFYQLLTLLPSERELESGPDEAMVRLGDWLDEDRTRISAFPVTEMVAEWRRRWGVEPSGLGKDEEVRMRRTGR